MLPVDDDVLLAADVAGRWASDSGIANTQLDEATWRRTVGGWQAVIVATKRGALNNLTGDNLKGTVKKIAATFDVPRSAVTWIEEHDDNPNRALLLVQPSNPLKTAQLWAGPDSIDMDADEATAVEGRHIDGTPMVRVLFRRGWGAPSGQVTGTTGGGKSMDVRQSLLIERWAHYVDKKTGEKRGAFISMLHDPKHMQSYAEYRNAVSAYGVTRDDAHILVDALLREMFRRYDLVSTMTWVDDLGRERHGGADWDPAVHGPIISVYWDEFHALAEDKELVKKLDQLARYQRACAMRGTILSHMSTLSDMGLQSLRDMLAGGRATLYRTTSGLNATLATGGQLVGDPRTLPKDPGMCYVADGETATLMGRKSWVPNDAQAKALGARSVYDWLFDADNNPIGYPAVIPPETVEAFGKEFMEWAAAGRRPAGRTPGSSKLFVAGASGQVTSSTRDDARAVDVLRRVAFDARGPFTRAQVVKNDLWVAAGLGITSTLGKSLAEAMKAGWLEKSSHGQYEMVASEQARMRAELDEARVVAAVESEGVA